MPLLDRIVTEDETFYGVIDYINKKHVVFFDTTKNDSADIVLLVISWRTTYQDDMRFSVFRDIFFPDIKIPVVLIPKRYIVDGISHLEDSSPDTERTAFKRRS